MEHAVGEELATVYSDSYKLGLLALRLRACLIDCVRSSA